MPVDLRSGGGKGKRQTATAGATGLGPRCDTLKVIKVTQFGGFFGGLCKLKALSVAAFQNTASNANKADNFKEPVQSAPLAEPSS